MRVLVTGGTGFIGGAVVQALLAGAGGHDVRVLSRRAGGPGPAGVAATRIAGDVRDPASLRRAADGIDTVIHAVQFPNHPVENPRRGYTYEAIDGQGTVNVAAACREAGVRRLLYVSGAGVRPGRTEPWFRAKETAEHAVRDFGGDWVIFRPSWVYGPRDRSLNKFVQMVRLLPVVPVIGSGQTRVQPVFVDDVARCVALAVDEPRASGQVFELGGPERLTMDQILRTVQRILRRHQPLVHVPAALVKLQASLLALLPNPPLSPAAIDFILMEETVDPRPAEVLFGVPFRSLEAGLRTYLGAHGKVQRPAAGAV